MAIGYWLLAGGLGAGTLLGVLAASQPAANSHEPTANSQQPAAQSQQCPTPRVSQWSSIRDSLWPLIAHRDGDEAWAHLDPAGLPSTSATWCNPLQNDAEALRAGRDLYDGRCAICHGESGRGDGPGAGPADPKPYDFTRPDFAGMTQPPGPAVLYAIMTRGIDNSAMGAYNVDLSGWERLAVIAYLTSLPGREALARSGAWADSLRRRRPAGN